MRDALGHVVYYVRLFKDPHAGLEEARRIADRIAEKHPGITLKQAEVGSSLYTALAAQELFATHRVTVQPDVTPERPGATYKLDMPDRVMPKLLDWDKPIPEQSEQVRLAIQKRRDGPLGTLLRNPHFTGESVVTLLRHHFGGTDYASQKASEYLASLGIPGLRYKDAMSRGAQSEVVHVSGTVAELGVESWMREAALRGEGPQQATRFIRDGIENLRRDQFAGSQENQRSIRQAEEAIALLENGRYKIVSQPASYNYVIWDQPTLDKIALLERNGEKLDAIRDAEEQAVAFQRRRANEEGLALPQQEVHTDPPKEEAQAVQSAIEGKSVMEAIQFVAETAPSPAYRLIAQRIGDQIQRLQDAGMRFDLRVTHLGEQVPASLIGTQALTFRPFKSDTTTLYIQGADVRGFVGVSYQTLLHELIHAATQTALYVGNRRVAEGSPLRESSKALFAVTNAIIAHFNARVTSGAQLSDFERAIHEGRNNALLSPDEVLAWALTNRHMQEYLEGIPYRGTTLWQRFVTAIREFLGLPAHADTALSEVLRVADDLLNAPVEQLMSLAKTLDLPTQINQYEGLANHQRAEHNPDTGTIALPITEAMKRSVLTEGQALFENSSKYAVREGEQQTLNFDLASAALGDLDRAGEAPDTLSATTGAVDRVGRGAEFVKTVGVGITAGCDE